ncbi:serine hydrolase domain-containing protein [Yinghuangia soli]|uniref:Beta-lactamase family protein n=1 Tax=Yinghuangia soli TaxID=2908204 RepID=A0AA41U376_9ACTN|nr:serine hydrolase domain-containing protein [Yinghuangia soli]MCF2529412.1 beta-lactamase family protein [Yinghuangia soli]
MRKLRTSVIGAAVGLAVLAGTAHVSNASSTTAAQKFQEAATGGVQVNGYPGVMGLIVDGDTKTYVTAGSSVYGSSTPIDPTAKYRIASNTKTFTSVAVLQLEAEGKLSIDDTVAKWLPNAVNANGYSGANITIRQLLNHTSGLPDYMPGELNTLYYTMQNVGTQYTPQELVNRALARTSTNPNRYYDYANTNYILAGMIIKAVTGNSPSVEITNRLITPLNLTNTSYPETSPDIYGNFVQGWKWQPTIFWWQLPILEATRSNTQIFGPAGAMISTLQDQATFERALIQGQLLPPAQMDKFKTTVPIARPGETNPTENTVGLGITRLKLDCTGSPSTWIWSNGGDVIGYHSRWFISDDGTKQVIYLGNEHHGKPLEESDGKKRLLAGGKNAMCELLKP